MKLFFAIWLCLVSFLAGAVPPAYERGALSTNGALQNAFAAGSVYVSAAYGSDTNSSPGPFATLAYAQSVAVSGQTIEVLDGTFAETGLGKAGVDWDFRRGTVANGGSAGVFLVTNSAPSLNVFGECRFTNTVIRLDKVTNGVVNLWAYRWDTTNNPLVLCTAQQSNRIYVRLTGPEHVAVAASGSLVRLEDQTQPIWVLAETRGTFTGRPMSSTAAGTTNPLQVVVLRPFIYLQPAGNTFGFGGNVYQNTFRLEGGSFSRNGQAATSAANLGTNFWFKGVSMQSTNDWPLDRATNTHGSFYYEAEHLLYSNP